MRLDLPPKKSSTFVSVKKELIRKLDALPQSDTSISMGLQDTFK
jgi:hypothetical protein